jgi:hypothetical protein
MNFDLFAELFVKFLLISCVHLPYNQMDIGFRRWNEPSPINIYIFRKIYVSASYLINNIAIYLRKSLIEIGPYYFFYVTSFLEFICTFITNIFD